MRKDNHFERVRLADILWLQADSNYTEIHTRQGKYIYATVLKKIEAALPGDQFFRVHRSYVVNRESITGFEGNMLMIGQQRIPVSKTYREKVFPWFNVV